MVLNSTIPAVRASITGPSGGGQMRSAAGGLGPRRVSAGAQSDHGVLHDPHRGGVEAFALQIGHIGGLRLGQGAAAGGDGQADEKGEEGTHRPRRWRDSRALKRGMAGA